VFPPGGDGFGILPWFHSVLQVGRTAIEGAGKWTGSRAGAGVTHSADQRQHPRKANH
jgi:hypothetical protein